MTSDIMQNLLQSVKNGEKVELDFDSSKELYNDIFDNHPVLLNYIHPDVLKSYVTLRQSCIFHSWKFIENYDENLNTNFEKLNKDTKKVIAFHSRIPDKDSPFVSYDEYPIKTNYFIQHFLSKIVLD